MLQINLLSQNYQIPNKHNKVVNFLGRNDRLERVPEQDSVETKKSSLKKAGIGAAVLALFTGVTLVAVSKGKKSKINNVLELSKQSGESAKRYQQELEKSRLERDIKRFFENEEREIAQKQKEMENSNKRNEDWLKEQHQIKEREYSDFWNKALEDKEKYNHISFDVKIKDAELGNNVDLEWHLGKFSQSKHTRNVLEECKDLTFDSPNLKLMKDKYDEDNIYDLGLRYAIVANNTAKEKGSSTIIKEIPKIFEGLEEKELTSKLDELPSLLDSKKINTFSIGKKDFQTELIGSGCLNDVYKISDNLGNEICYKFGRDPYLMNSGQGFYNEFAILNEANRAGVVDVPKLYMGNPVGSYAQNPNFIGSTSRGSWAVIELVKPNAKVPSDGLKIHTWLRTKGLFHGDINSGTFVGDKVVDLGGICDDARTVNSIHDSAHCINWLFRAYHSGKTSQEVIDIMDKLVV